MWVLQFIMILFCLCFGNDMFTVQSNCLQSTVNFQILFVVWCSNTSTHKSNVFEILYQI